MKVFVTPQAEKQLSKLPSSYQVKVKKRLQYLSKNPFAGKKLVGELKNKWSMKVWPYRIIYIINQNRQIWIVSVLHRQGVYK